MWLHEKYKIYTEKVIQIASIPSKEVLIAKLLGSIKAPLSNLAYLLNAIKEKNIWILLIFILSGLVIGGLLGELAGKIDILWWLGYGKEFGLASPLTLDLSIIQVTFGLVFKINIASIIGMALAILIYRKV